MKWEKVGVVFDASGRTDWMHSFTYVPTALLLNEKTVRVYFASRDAENVGRVGWFDVDANEPTKVVGFSKEPCLDIGEDGCFDDNGVTPLSAFQDEDGIRLYYAGWQLTPKARYMLFTGLAISKDGGNTFHRHQKSPVLDRSPSELVVRSGAYIMKHAGIYKIWYAAGSGFVDVSGKQVPTYHLAYAESKDGINWPSEGTLSIEPQAPDEYGFGRPGMLISDDEFNIFYSSRTFSKGYRIGCATSRDGKHWTRHDELGLEASVSGWDSEMTCFASIIETPTGTLMFYNGNDFGRTGVGLAKMITRSVDTANSH